MPGFSVRSLLPVFRVPRQLQEHDHATPEALSDRNRARRQADPARIAGVIRKNEGRREKPDFGSVDNVALGFGDRRRSESGVSKTAK